MFTGGVRKRHGLPGKYGPPTLKPCGTGPESPSGDAAPQISSRPKRSRVGTPVPVGSGAIHWLYQDWMPGQYWVAHAVPLSAEPELWSATICSPDSMSVQVWPKSAETYTPPKLVGIGAPRFIPASSGSSLNFAASSTVA